MRVDLRIPQALAGRYRLAPPARPPRGPAGDHLSRGVGSSVEFQDFRPYVPGDDPRHIDWAAVARTDQLILRLHRADVQLSLDILLDTSRSMALYGGAKAERAAQLSYLLALLGRKAGARTTIWAAGAEALPFREALETRLGDLRFEARASLGDLLRDNPPRLETGSLRFVVSDFLFPHDPSRLVSFLARGAAGGAAIQLLSGPERDPGEEGLLRLLDVETGEERQMSVDAGSIREYKDRLGKLQEGLMGASRAARLPLAIIPAELPIEEMCRGPLVQAGIVEPT